MFFMVKYLRSSIKSVSFLCFTLDFIKCLKEGLTLNHRLIHKEGFCRFLSFHISKCNSDVVSVGVPFA